MKLRTLLAVIGPGLITLSADNDAGFFSTMAQAGQQYGTSLLWVFLLLIPVLYITQEMTVRLGAVTGRGHALLIFQKYGKFWGFSTLGALLAVNAATLVTEFIGISLGLSFLGIPQVPGVIVAAAFMILAVSMGTFRRFEILALTLVGGSIMLIPLFLFVHPPVGQIAHDLVTPTLVHRDALALVIAIIGTTVAPFQIYFMQSATVDKGLKAEHLKYGRMDLVLGVMICTLGSVALLSVTSMVPGTFIDAGDIAHKLGGIPGTLWSIALIDASILGACAVSLSSAYAMGDVLRKTHSLNKSFKEGKLFYAVYGLLIIVSAACVLIPGVPLGAITNAVQTLAGALLPFAIVFLWLLCNDKKLLGQFANGRLTNVLTGVIIIVLTMLSLYLVGTSIMELA